MPNPKTFAECYPEWVQDVARLIVAADPGVTFGLYARWGSGKSSACGALERSIYDAAHEKARIAVVVTLNAYALRQSPRAAAEVALSRELDISVTSKKSDGRQVKALFDVISRFLPPAVSATGVPGSTAASAAISVLAQTGSGLAGQRSDAEASRLVEDLDADKVIVFIDDLDRCRPDEALHVLAQCVDPVAARVANVLIACDPEVLASHAASAFGVSRVAGLEAISKYVNVPLYLPTGITKAHSAAYERHVAGASIEMRDRLVAAAVQATGIVPVREILAALPQATLWALRTAALHGDADALALAHPIFYTALLAVILPEIVRVAQISPESFNILSELVRKAAETEKTKLGAYPFTG